jgi:hypothetical protein
LNIKSLKANKAKEWCIPMVDIDWLYKLLDDDEVIGSNGNTTQQEIQECFSPKSAGDTSRNIEQDLKQSLNLLDSLPIPSKPNVLGY